jgi:hypothetical protein
MQLTNGAIKSGVKQPPMNHTLVDEFEGVDLDSFDLSAFVMPAQSASNVAKAASKDLKNTEVEKFLSESSDLVKLGEQYEVDVVERGHKALYDLLASIYDLSLRIEQNQHKDKILEAIRTELKDTRDTNLKANTPAVAVMVKYVVRSDKSTLSRYTKVLSVAQQENLAPADLPAYITRRGGVGQIQEIESQAMAKKSGDKSSKERTALIRELFEVMGMASKLDLQFDGNVVSHSEEKEPSNEKAQPSSFCVLVAHHVSDNKYKIISANDLGRAYEDNLVKYLGKAMPNDLTVLEHGVRNFKRRISLDPSQPESLRREMEKQLAIPLKYKKTEVIEMENGDEAPI